MNDDATLLRQYAQEGSDGAFRELVERHIALVNATARRLAGGDAHLADDVTQLVFTDLARKAATLPGDVLLGGWLHRHTCYTAMKAVRGESRRRVRERTAMETNLLNEDSARDEQWAKLAPVLDEALDQLGAEDRNAIVLRYLQQRDMRSIGETLGTSENAAQKRLGRALDKLRELLTRRGITVSSALLATTLDAGAASAPMSHGLAMSVSAQALSSAAAATTTTFTLTSLKTMINTKLALGAAAVILTAGAATYALTQNNSSTGEAPVPAAKAAAAAPAAKPQIVAASPAKVEAPKVAPAPAGGASVAVDTAPAPETAGVSYTLSQDDATVVSGGGKTVMITGTGGVVTGTGGVVTGQLQALTTGSGPNTMTFTTGMMDPNSLGDPVSTVVNADGSTTNTYNGPHGETITMTQGADGKSKSLRVMSTSNTAHFNTAGTQSSTLIVSPAPANP